MAKGGSTIDPYTTAAAQTASNKETANYQQSLNMVNQNTPYGSLTYTQDGNWANGAPKYTATTSLSPEMQSLYDTGTQTTNTLANTANSLASRAESTLANPLDLKSASETKYEQLARSRLDPLWATKAQQNEQDLINRGITPGSEAYSTLKNQFQQGENDAYNGLYVTGKQLFDQEATAERNQTLNELSALMSGSQVQSPNFTSTPQTGVANTDVSGIYNAYNKNQTDTQAATLGGLFGLGGAAVKGLFTLSDRRAKRDVRRISTRADGLGVYSYRYLWSDVEHIGFMADEVEAIYPDAVAEIGGLKAVNYGAL